MNQDSRHYLFLLRRFWWLLAITGLAVGVAGYVYNQSQPKVYEANTRLFIGNAIQSVDPETSQLETAVRLAAVYAELAHNYGVLYETIQELGLEETPDELDTLITTEVGNDTPFLTIYAKYGSPETAAAIANTLANTLLQTSINQQMDNQVQRLSDLQNQIDNLQALIDITNSEHQAALAALSEARESGDSEADLDLLTTRVANLTDQLNSAYGALARLTGEFLTLSNSTNQVSILEEARPNYESQGTNVIIVVAAGVIFGVMLGAIIAIVIDLFDNTIRTESQVKIALNLPILGRIPRLRWSKQRYLNLLESKEILNQNVSEAYRSIISDLIFTGDENPEGAEGEGRTRTYLITSPRSHNGRTFTAMNLAIMSASYGLRTLLIDGDFRSPDIHHYFSVGMKYQDEIAKLIRELSDKPLTTEEDEEMMRTLSKLLVRSGQGYQGLSIIRGDAGLRDPEATATLTVFHDLRQIITLVNKVMKFDVIIIDTSPVLNNADSMNMATHLNADVLLLVESGVTKSEDALKAIEQYDRRGLSIRGVILNRG